MNVDPPPQAAGGPHAVSDPRAHFLTGHSAARYYLAPQPGMRPVLDGMFDTFEFKGGLNLLRVDVRDVQGVDMAGALSPGLRLACVVGGRSDVAYGDRRVVLGPMSPSRLQCSMVALHAPEPLLKRSRRGDRERTVALTLTPEWLETRLNIELRDADLLAAHLSSCTWGISMQATTLAEQILRPPELSPALLRLYLESRALDIVVESLAYLEKMSCGTAPVRAPMSRSPTAAPTPLRERERQRMNDVRDLLDSGAADDMSLDAIADRVCVSVNTLQRHFRQAWGKTVFAYVRDNRLMQARIAMERDGISITVAADLAGYTSTANFATAFRKRFGITPSQVRVRS